MLSGQTMIKDKGKLPNISHLIKFNDWPKEIKQYLIRLLNFTLCAIGELK